MRRAHSKNISGMILAAGESKRMGEPKALLKFAGGRTLLETQVALLKSSGCERVRVVIGAHAKEILAAHKELDVEWVENKDWPDGQFSSIKAGIKFLSPSPHPSPSRGEGEGVILLPVDTAPVANDTVNAIIETALRNPRLDAVIPEYEGKGGHPIFLSAKFCHILTTRPNNSRLDKEIGSLQNKLRLPVSDRNVTININTPSEWEEFRKLRIKI